MFIPGCFCCGPSGCTIQVKNGGGNTGPGSYWESIDGEVYDYTLSVWNPATSSYLELSRILGAGNAPGVVLYEKTNIQDYAFKPAGTRDASVVRFKMVRGPDYTCTDCASEPRLFFTYSQQGYEFSEGVRDYTLVNNCNGCEPIGCHLPDPKNYVIEFDYTATATSTHPQELASRVEEAVNIAVRYRPGDVFSYSPDAIYSNANNLRNSQGFKEENYFSLSAATLQAMGAPESYASNRFYIVMLGGYTPAVSEFAGSSCALFTGGTPYVNLVSNVTPYNSSFLWYLVREVDEQRTVFGVPMITSNGKAHYLMPNALMTVFQYPSSVIIENSSDCDLRNDGFIVVHSDNVEPVPGLYGGPAAFNHVGTTGRIYSGSHVSSKSVLGYPEPFVWANSYWTACGFAGSGTDQSKFSVASVTIEGYLNKRPTIQANIAGVIHISADNVYYDFWWRVFRGATKVIEYGSDDTPDEGGNTGSITNTFTVSVGDVITLGDPGDYNVLTSLQIWWTPT